MQETNTKYGLSLGFIAYILWGFLPIYWKLLETFRADVVLTHRIIWSFIFMILFIVFTNKSDLFIAECKNLFKEKKKIFYIAFASVLISANWLIFIWAVQNDYVVQASLGYYINPLINILLGVIFLQEKLSNAQKLSFVLAAIGVTFLTLSYGVFPWVSLSLAFSFGFYGLFKKLVQIDSAFSLIIETFFVTPIALGYLFIMFGTGIGITSAHSPIDISLLLFSGVATAIPLLLFGYAVLHLPLSLAGILQYIAPTIMLIIGVFLYKEPFTFAHFITFLCIWIALILFVGSSFKKRQKEQLTD